MEHSELEIEDEKDTLLDKRRCMRKDAISLVFIGHVDSGKSTLCGNILVLTGNIDSRTLEKYRTESKEMNRESWYLSWALDTNPDEREKGITITCGQSVFETQTKRCNIIDAPGHKLCVPNMIIGASQADVAILVISARKGEFETGFDKGGQTKEHAMLAKTIGVKEIVVAINKMDDPTVSWSKDRYNECVQKLIPFLRSVGFVPERDCSFIPISALTGINVYKKVDKTICEWYSGPPLIECIDDISPLERSGEKSFIMVVSGKTKDSGTFLNGKIISGSVRIGGSAILAPGNHSVEIAAIYVGDEDVETARSGEVVVLKIKGLDEEEKIAGSLLCSPENPIIPTCTFECMLFVVAHRNIITAGYSAVLHVHTAVEDVSLIKIKYEIDPNTKKPIKDNPVFIKQKQAAVVVMKCSTPICIGTYQECPQIGRLTIRDENTTVAIGFVTKIL